MSEKFKPNAPEKSSEIRWDLITSTIKKKNDDYINNYDSFSHSETMRVTEADSLEYDSDGFINFFKQTDGSSVELVRRKNEAGLYELDDAVFKSDEGKELFRLSNLFPRKYIILEEAKSLGYDFMLMTDPPIIVMAPNFLSTVIGRMHFLHELGHILDHEENPRDRKELADNLNGLTHKNREENAWIKAFEIIEKIKNLGGQFLPKDFEKSFYWREYAEEAISQHNFKQ
jgi:hypothetical protein